MTQPEQPTLGDRVLADLERQISEPDPRYAQKCRELAIVRAQYAELTEFVRSRADVLGLNASGSDGKTPLSQEPVEDVTPSANGKPLPKDSTKTGQ